MSRPSRMPRVPRLAALSFLPALLVLPGAPLAAQAVPAASPAAPALETPFRRGQWAMQFAVTSGAQHVGFLKFRSPTSAWLFDLGVNVGGTRQRLTPVDTTRSFPGNYEERFVGTQVTLGRRGYRALTPRAVRYTTIGLSGGHAYSEGSRLGRTTGNSTDWNGGVILDLGGAYFLTPGVSVGGSIGLGAFYTRGERNFSDSRAQASEGVRAGLDGGQLLFTVHF